MSVRLEVPFISQLVNGMGGNNCGPACLAMMLAFRGAIDATQEAMLTVADIVRDGVPDGNGVTGGYTTFQQLQETASYYGCASDLLWSWGAVQGRLDAGEPVILLVDNTVLAPREYPISPAFNAHHFILLTGYVTEASTAPTNDPLAIDYTPGEYYYWSIQQGATNVGGVQAMALVPVSAPQESIPMDTTPEERAAMKPYFDQLGQDCWMDSGIMQRAALAYKRGETRGPATSGEYPATTADGRPSNRQNFSAAICEAYQGDDGTWQINWMELVLHPEAITG